MDGDLLLGLDLGTSTCKALLLDASGTEVAVAAAPTPFVSSEGLTEMRVEDLWATAGGLIPALGDRRSRVAAVGIAGMAECGAPLDRSGGVLAHVISWHDPRGEEVVRRLTEAFGDSLGLRTGQRPRAVSSVAKLGWLVANGCGPVERWIGVPELCLWDLTGTQATEHSLASRTGCYDVLEGRYLPDVAAAAGRSAGVFAAGRRAGGPMGRGSGGDGSRGGPALAERLQAGAPVVLPGKPPGGIWKGLLIALAARTAEATRRVRALGVPSDRMLVIGGGSASIPWMRAKAEVIPLPLLR